MTDDLPQSEIVRLNEIIRQLKKAYQTLEDGHRQHQDRQAIQSPAKAGKRPIEHIEFNEFNTI